MLQENDKTRFLSSIFIEYKQRFIAFAASYVRDGIIAEDIVMESFLYYWENKSLIKNDTNIPAYILSIVKSKSLNHLRRQRTHLKAENKIKSYQDRLLQQNIISLEACNPQYLFSNEVQEIIDKIIQDLPPKTKEIFLRSRFENQTYKGIAFEMGISEKNVEAHMSKALTIFRLALRDYFPFFILFLYNK